MGAWISHNSNNTSEIFLPISQVTRADARVSGSTNSAEAPAEQARVQRVRGECEDVQRDALVIHNGTAGTIAFQPWEVLTESR
jgi:hypothetical protein